MSNVGVRPFGIVMWTNSLTEFFFFDGGCLWKMTGSKKEVVVVKMVVGVVERVVSANLRGVVGGGYISVVYDL